MVSVPHIEVEVDATVVSVPDSAVQDSTVLFLDESESVADSKRAEESVLVGTESYLPGTR